MNRIVISAATVIAAAGAIAGSSAASASTGAGSAPHVTRCGAQLRAINAAERGDIGARGLAAAGLPELAAAARAATTISGARQFGVALEATSSNLPCGPNRPLPGWFHWGGSSDRSHGLPCIVAWGGSGSSSAEICEAGTAQPSHLF